MRHLLPIESDGGLSWSVLAKWRAGYLAVDVKPIR